MVRYNFLKIVMDLEDTTPQIKGVYLLYVTFVILNVNLTKRMSMSFKKTRLKATYQKIDVILLIKFYFCMPQ